MKSGGAKREDEYAALRRLQMAAESGRCMAVYFRPLAAEKLSTPAHLRVALARRGSLLEVRIPKRRGPPLALPLTVQAGWQRRFPAPPPEQPPSHSIATPERAHVLSIVR